MSQEDLHPGNIPVKLEPYRSLWPKRFEREKTSLAYLLGELIQDIQHFGSTSVPNLTAKATVDIMLGTAGFPWPDSADRLLETSSYTFYKEPKANWRVYLKPYKEAQRGYHLHIVEHKSEHWRAHMLFRDYLRQHPEVANEYGDLKVNLANQLAGKRGAYQQSKKAYIDALMKQAENWLEKHNGRRRLTP